MDRLLTGLLLACLFLINPAAACHKLKFKYLAVFCSREFVRDWDNKSPDYLFVPDSWSDLNTFLAHIAKEAGDKPILIELHVHGSEDGLSITTELSPTIIQEDTTFGYVAKKIEEALPDKDLTVLTEACESGNAYKTIRNNKDPRLDYVQVPYFPIYGADGDGWESYSNWGPTVFYQYRDNIRYHFNDLREFEYRPKRPTEKNLPCGLSKTCLELKAVDEFYENRRLSF